MGRQVTPIYYINLDRVPERRTFMDDQFAAQGLRAERISAVDAFDNPQPAEYCPAGWLSRWSLTTSEVACFESHRVAWRAVRDGEAPFGVIMEDDAILSAGFGDALASLSEAGRLADVIKLDGANQPRRLGPVVDMGGVSLRPLIQTIGSAAAYALSRESAARLEKRAARYCDHLDDFIFTPSRDWRPMQMTPAVAVQGMFIEDEASDRADSVDNSERTSDTRINADDGRGPPLYRLSKELKRGGRKLGWKLWGDGRLIANGGLIGCPPLADDLGQYRR